MRSHAMLRAGNALTAVVAAGIAQTVTPVEVPAELENAVDFQRDTVKQVCLPPICLYLLTQPKFDNALRRLSCPYVQYALAF